MFERYTDRAKRAVELAREEAADLGHDTVGTEHLLLGLIEEGGGVAFTALDALGVTAKAANEAVCRRHPAGTGRSAGWLPWSLRFRKVQELALREAIELGNNFVATEHLLLGLIREGSDTGALALADCGTAEGDRGFSSDVRAKVLELLRGYDDAERPKPAVPGPILALEDGETVAGLFASWAQREGILARVTEKECADLAKAFMYGFACGAGSAAAKAPSGVSQALSALYESRRLPALGVELPGMSESALTVELWPLKRRSRSWSTRPTCRTMLSAWSSTRSSVTPTAALSTTTSHA